MLLRLSLFLEGWSVYVLCCVSLFTSGDASIPANRWFWRTFWKKAALTEPQGGLQIICSSQNTQKQTCSWRRSWARCAMWPFPGPNRGSMYASLFDQSYARVRHLLAIERKRALSAPSATSRDAMVCRRCRDGRRAPRGPFLAPQRRSARRGCVCVSVGC